VQRGHHAGTVAPVAVGILIELGVPDPMPSLNTSAVSHQLQQGFWGGAQAGEKQVAGAKGLAVTNQLIETNCPTRDLGDRPLTDRPAERGHIHLVEEVAERGIRWRNALDLGSSGSRSGFRAPPPAAGSRP
jgi:hypothetical protein